MRVVEYGARQFVLEVDTPAPAFLVTSETAYPGWHAWVDGQPRAPVTTNVAFRGLAVPAGKHMVKMRFDPEILWRAAWLTLAAAFGLGLSLIWPFGLAIIRQALGVMDFKEQLKSSVDIVKVIGEHVRLRKSGVSRYTGLCPFHNEKTPSFSVHAGHQFYKCFGCGASGDVLKFVMEFEHVSFPEALKLLAERNGIPMPKRAEYADPETRLRAAVYQIQELAQEAFREHLAGPAGAEARRYLEKRGVAPEVSEQFGLGYADRSGRFLLRILEKQQFTAEQMENSGLLGRREDGSFYDRFRNRLMFPIHNESGKVIGFGGRALDPADEAKYLNSAESPIYKKSAVLYNLHRAKEGIRKADRAVLVEGYMDAIGVSAAGVREVVASCGTSLTTQHVQTLRRHSDKIVVNFDPDAAGAERRGEVYQPAAGREHEGAHRGTGGRSRSGRVLQGARRGGVSGQAGQGPELFLLAGGSGAGEVRPAHGGGPRGGLSVFAAGYSTAGR